MMIIITDYIITDYIRIDNLMLLIRSNYFNFGTLWLINLRNMWEHAYVSKSQWKIGYAGLKNCIRFRKFTISKKYQFTILWTAY